GFPERRAQRTQAPLPRELWSEEAHGLDRFRRAKLSLHSVAQGAHQVGAVLDQHALVERPKLSDALLVRERVEAAERLALLDDEAEPALQESTAERGSKIGECDFAAHGRVKQLRGKPRRDLRARLLKCGPARREVEILK